MGIIKEAFKKENFIIKEITSNEFPFPSLIICTVDDLNKSAESFLLFNDTWNYHLCKTKFSYPNDPVWEDISIIDEAIYKSIILYYEELSKLTQLRIVRPTISIDEMKFMNFALLRHNNTFMDAINEIYGHSSCEELKKLIDLLKQVPKITTTSF